MRYVWGDIESTGLGNDAGIVEISWIETDEHFNEVASFYSLINPMVPIQFGAMAVHGITEDMVADAPTIEEFMRREGYPLAGEGVILCAHSAPFDIKFFGPWMDEPNTLCTLKCARVLYPEAENHKQGTLAAMLGIVVQREKAHSADGDLDVLSQLLQRMCADFDLTLPHLMEVQKRPRKIMNMPFGKHKGTPLADLPDDYVYWLLHKTENLDSDLRASLESL